MSDYRESVKRAIRDLQSEKQGYFRSVQRVDVKIAQLEEVLRDEIDADPVREPGVGAKRGDAEKEIRALFDGGGSLNAAEIARLRGTSTNAASNVIRRLVKQGVIAPTGHTRGYYWKVSANGGQGSLPAEPERDDETLEAGGS
jgi:Fic family protein